MAAKNYQGYVQHSSFLQMKQNWQNLKVKQKILGSDTRLDTMRTFVQDRVKGLLRQLKQLLKQL